MLVAGFGSVYMFLVVMVVLIMIVVVMIIVVVVLIMIVVVMIIVSATGMVRSSFMIACGSGRVEGINMHVYQRNAIFMQKGVPDFFGNSVALYHVQAGFYFNSGNYLDIST